MNTSEIRAKARELRAELDSIPKDGTTHAQLTRGEAIVEELRKLERLEQIETECERQRALDAPVRKSFAQSLNYPEEQSEARDTAGGRIGAPVYLRSAEDLRIPRAPHPFGEDAGAFMRALISGRHDPRLMEAELRANTLAPPAAGGFLVPEQTTTGIFGVALETSMLMKAVRTYVLDGVKKLHVPAFQDNDRSGGLLYGGMRLYWQGEASALQEANPKARQVCFEPVGLKGYCTLSNELIAGSNSGLVSEFTRMIGEAAGWAIDNAFISGDGAGKPLGVLDAACPCTIEVAAEGGQTPDTIIYKNLIGMYSRMIPSARNGAAWYITNDAVPQLLQLTIPIGTAGEHIPALRESDGKFTLLGSPVYFSEKMSKLGDRGDILLANWSYYGCAIVGGINVATSEHALFTSDSFAIRATVYLAGGPLLESAITPFKGSLTTSAFVTLAAR